MLGAPCSPCCARPICDIITNLVSIPPNTSVENEYGGWPDIEEKIQLFLRVYMPVFNSVNIGLPPGYVFGEIVLTAYVESDAGELFNDVFRYEVVNGFGPESDGWELTGDGTWRKEFVYSFCKPQGITSFTASFEDTNPFFPGRSQEFNSYRFSCAGACENPLP
jgi:hypothetical protein